MILPGFNDEEVLGKGEIVFVVCCTVVCGVLSSTIVVVDNEVVSTNIYSKNIENVINGLHGIKPGF